MFNLRIAITPSGVPHIGNLYIIFINYILKNKLLGNIYLRFDNTNQTKNKNINKLYIIKNLKKQGFYLKKIFSQTINLNFYFKKKNIFIKKIIFKKKFFNVKLFILNISYSLFLFINSTKIKFIDNNYKTIKNYILDHKEILVKKNGIPTYNFSSIIDDILNNTFIIIRGKEWLNQLKIQTIILDNFNKNFIFHHLPNINVYNKKLSKRNNIKDLNLNKVYKKIFFVKKNNIINIIYYNIYKNFNDIRITYLFKKKKKIKKNNFIMNIINIINHINPGFFINLYKIHNMLNNHIRNLNLNVSNFNFIEKNLFDINSILSNLKFVDIKNLFTQV
ncbi:glutamate--tRNA ligase family protein [Candidatus Carsonella ruddii]|uniref:Putative glutamyl-tRNA synthetase n=1 Tax=Candidatus Carsonella ruddii PC isolate NHV TaxID=1202540 RepID=J3Z244_CARRU|nr:glutamate--tRNA ligase family protein [Candidatus Carsonella ruddii]AFP84329.1 putative glutamyl-tRNA synthetase [Candidatus Carsonella ruddii PC isolate NHV]